MSKSKQSKTGFGLNPLDELNDLRMSEKALPLLEQVRKFVREVVDPMSVEFHKLGEGRKDRFAYVPMAFAVARRRLMLRAPFSPRYRRNAAGSSFMVRMVRATMAS